MSSAIRFNLDQSKILSAGNGLSIVGKGENTGNHLFFFSFSLMCFLPSPSKQKNHTSPHSSFGRVLNFKTGGCGFNSLACQPKSYSSSFGWDFKQRSHVTLLYSEHVKEPGGALSTFILYPCTLPSNN